VDARQRSQFTQSAQADYGPGMTAVHYHPRQLYHPSSFARFVNRLPENARREPGAIKQVDKLLAASGKTMHDIMAEGLIESIDEVERIDRLITIAENRRNVSLREIDRRRAALGDALRRGVQEAEDAEFEVIETSSAKRKDVA
jgi:hypothetical protein